MKNVLKVAVAVLAAGVLAACGGNEEYSVSETVQRAEEGIKVFCNGHYDGNGYSVCVGKNQVQIIEMMEEGTMEIYGITKEDAVQALRATYNK